MFTDRDWTKAGHIIQVLAPLDHAVHQVTVNCFIMPIRYNKQFLESEAVKPLEIKVGKYWNNIPIMGFHVLNKPNTYNSEQQKKVNVFKICIHNNL